MLKLNFWDLSYGGSKTEFCCSNMEIFKLFCFVLFLMIKCLRIVRNNLNI